MYFSYKCKATSDSTAPASSMSCHLFYVHVYFTSLLIDFFPLLHAVKETDSSQLEVHVLQ